MRRERVSMASCPASFLLIRYINISLDLYAGGQLGLGDDNDYWKPTRVKNLADESKIYTNEDLETGSWRTLDISCGLNHTAAIVEITEGS